MHEPLAKALRFRAGQMHIDLADGRLLVLPLELYPTLKRMTAKQREQWVRIGPGIGFSWPEHDLDLSVRGMLEGRPEHVPAKRKRLAPAAPRRRQTRQTKAHR